MRKLILVAGLAFAGFSINSQAKVGDTLAQLDQRYSTALTCEVDGGNAYVQKGWFILAVFDQANICQGIAFARINQPLSEADCNQLDDENIPANSGQWKEIPIASRFQTEKMRARMWLSPKLAFIIMALEMNEEITGLTFNERIYANWSDDLPDLFDKVGELLQKASGLKMPVTPYMLADSHGACPIGRSQFAETATQRNKEKTCF